MSVSLYIEYQMKCKYHLVMFRRDNSVIKALNEIHFACDKLNSYMIGCDYRREKSLSNELDITIDVIPSQLSGHCDVINRTKTERVKHGDDV